ncbi:MAG: Bax inhibitor-1 family protein [Cellvibrio sp.]|nr:Bax inhibitor-1 family protein [Cellvibrio sp.]
MQNIYKTPNAALGVAETNKVLRNTYILLSITLAFSAVTAFISMALGLSHNVGLVLTITAIALIWFVLPKTANSANGILVVFVITGLVGAGLGPTLSYYLSSVNGGQIVLQALAGTALIFGGLSVYVLTTKKDFSFLRGFVVVGYLLMIAICVFLIIAHYAGYDFSTFNLVFSAAIILLMSASILYQTSAIIHGGETNYLFATISLYVSIINLFTSLLHLLGAAGDD